MTLKQKMVRILFGVEVFLVIVLYFFGAQGLYALMYLQYDVQKLATESAVLAQDIKKLEEECADWQNDPFYIEQCAREKLAMARDGDQIYVVK